MNEETMMTEIERIFGAALDARRKAARLGITRTVDGKEFGEVE